MGKRFTVWPRFMTFCAVAAMVAAISPTLADTHYVSTNGHHQTPFINWYDAATNFGQGVAVARDGDTVVVSNGIFRQNLATGIGYAITITSLYGAAETVIDGCSNPIAGIIIVGAFTSTIHGLTITHFSLGSGNGGGIYSQGQFVKVVDCHIVANSNRIGGGIEIYSGNLWASNCVISGNTATMGAYGGGGLNFLSGYANTGRLDNCIISSNIAVAGWGGGIMAGNPIVVQNCTISDNTSASYGGGIACIGGVTLMSNCRLTGNLAQTAYGGGAYGGNLDNCLIANNGATGSIAGGVYGGNLRNCTVVSNLANRGGGVYLGRIVNSIVYFNRSQEAGYQSYSNYLYDAAANWSNCCTAPSLGSNCITADPRMYNMPADCHLMKGSPCINTGSNNYSWMIGGVDLDGRKRIRDFTVDVGAFEWIPQGTTFNGY